MKIDKDEKRRIYDTEMIRLKARRDFEKEGSGGKWVWLIVILMLAGGAFFLLRRGAGPSRLMKEVDQIIAAAENQPGQNVGEIWDQLATLIEAEEDTAALATLVRETREATEQIEAPAKGLRAECYWMAETGALLRLGELGTDEAAAALVGLLCDERLDWDKQRNALNIAHTISLCGKPCLPHLKSVPADHPRRGFVDHLIPYLQRGELIE
jgi:hypothetical protein